jgi:hypothetical protein
MQGKNPRIILSHVMRGIMGRGIFGNTCTLMRRPENGPICLLIAGGLCLLITSCGDFERSLPGSYSLVRFNADEIMIVKRVEPGDGIKTVIGPKIKGYKVSKAVVIGEVVLPDSSALKNESTPGYFVLDTDTGDVRQGLKREEWLAILKSKGIQGDINLARPSSWEWLWGANK